MAKVIFIIGPTASGKTDLSIQLAKHIKTEIISADSRQCYKYLNIGTAKPTFQQLTEVKHYFIDILDPSERFTAGLFAKQANEIIYNLQAANKIPIVVGGSGLYIDALMNGLQDECDYDPILRERLQRDLKLYGVEYLFSQLQIVDPEYSQIVSKNDWRRILRALEYCYLTNKKFSDVSQQKNNTYDNIIVNICWDREILYERINKRVDIMIENGLIQEVKDISNMGYNKDINSLNTVGYKEIFAYLDGEITLIEAIELIKKNTRNYAKKQITFFKKYQNEAINFNPAQDSINELIKIIEKKIIS